MMMEFVSQLRETEARVFLTDAVKVFNVLATNLERRRVVYAGARSRDRKPQLAGPRGRLRRRRCPWTNLFFGVYPYIALGPCS